MRRPGLFLFGQNMKFTYFESALRLLVALACFLAVPAQADETLSESRADFRQETPRGQARSLADQVVRTADTDSRPFAIVDKIAARVYVFDAEGRLIGAAAALLGIAIGDHSAPGVGTLDLAAIRMEDRTTPAGRFQADIGRNYDGKEILWVDYNAAISMHPVINTKPAERRPHRLATPTASDNRISFGCINVPAGFFKTVVSRAFSSAGGVVYILPELASSAPISLLKVPANIVDNLSGFVVK
jgi:hypothetical protein